MPITDILKNIKNSFLEEYYLDTELTDIQKHILSILFECEFPLSLTEIEKGLKDRNINTVTKTLRNSIYGTKERNKNLKGLNEIGLEFTSSLPTKLSIDEEYKNQALITIKREKRNLEISLTNFGLKYMKELGFEKDKKRINQYLMFSTKNRTTAMKDKIIYEISPMNKKDQKKTIKGVWEHINIFLITILLLCTLSFSFSSIISQKLAMEAYNRGGFSFDKQEMLEGIISISMNPENESLFCLGNKFSCSPRELASEEMKQGTPYNKGRAGAYMIFALNPAYQEKNECKNTFLRKVDTGISQGEEEVSMQCGEKTFIYNKELEEAIISEIMGIWLNPTVEDIEPEDMEEIQTGIAVDLETIGLDRLTEEELEAIEKYIESRATIFGSDEYSCNLPQTRKNTFFKKWRELQGTEKDCLISLLSVNKTTFNKFSNQCPFLYGDQASAMWILDSYAKAGFAVKDCKTVTYTATDEEGDTEIQTQTMCFYYPNQIGQSCIYEFEEMEKLIGLEVQNESIKVVFCMGGIVLIGIVAVFIWINKDEGGD